MNVSFFLDRYQKASVFVPFRRRMDVLSTWMNLIKLMISYYPPSQPQIAAKVVLKVSKMSRVFFVSNNQTSSLAFPFHVEIEEERTVVRTFSGREIDSRISSDILALVAVLQDRPVLDAWDFLEFSDQSGELSDDFWPVFSELIDAEDGYLRFDHDPKNQKGHLHPLDHADLFYTNGAKFKLGLDKTLDIEEVISMLDVETDCHYLTLKK